MFVRDRVMTTYHASWAESRERMSSHQTDAYRAELVGQGREPEYRNLEMRIGPATPAWPSAWRWRRRVRWLCVPFLGPWMADPQL
ncbi:hypothetical protein GCM10023317_90400 [Actinopolymorpha pittospori]